MIRLLIVDDQMGVTKVLKNFFEEKNYEVNTATTIKECIEIIKSYQPHIIFLDVLLPDGSGVDIIPKIKEINPEAKIIMITAVDEQKVIEKCFQLGATDYIVKPFSLKYLEDTVLRKVYSQLFDEIKKQKEIISKAYEKIVYILAKVIEEKDVYLAGHSERVTEYSIDVAKELGLPQEKIHLLEQAGKLHDIGKIGVSDDVLHKPGKLNESEWQEVKQHPSVGAELLGYLENFREQTESVKSHHERYDGSGYPDKLRGEDIPLLARILSVSDAYDAMTTKRPYRETYSPQQAVRELIKNKGTQFDPNIVDIFVKILVKKGVVKETEI